MRNSSREIFKGALVIMDEVHAIFENLDCLKLEFSNITKPDRLLLLTATVTERLERFLELWDIYRQTYQKSIKINYNITRFNCDKKYYVGIV